jgi:hypothetical protein
LHPVQQAFLDHEALQCGYCTPGMVMAAVGLLRASASPSDADIVKAMDHNTLPLRHLPAHRRGDQAGGGAGGKSGR